MKPVLGFALWLVVSLLLPRQLESHMVTHALVQLPLLAVSGALIAPRWNGVAHPLAVPALLVGLFAAAIWMLPRMLDATLSHSSVEWVKLLSTPMLVGVPIGWSWSQLSALTRAIVWSNLVSMFLTLGWLYLEAPVRVCNFYATSEQRMVGLAYLGLAAAIVAYWLPRIFIGGTEHNSSSRDPAFVEPDAHTRAHKPRRASGPLLCDGHSASSKRKAATCTTTP